MTALKMAAALVATLAATALVAQVVPPYFTGSARGRRGWGVAVALAMASGAGLVAVAGSARLGRVCGGTAVERPRLRGSDRTRPRARLAGRRPGAALRRDVRRAPRAIARLVAACRLAWSRPWRAMASTNCLAARCRARTNARGERGLSAHSRPDRAARRARTCTGGASTA